MATSMGPCRGAQVVICALLSVAWALAPGASFPLVGATLCLDLRRKGRLVRTLARGHSDGSGEAALSFTVPAIFVGEVTLRLVAPRGGGRR